MTTGAAMGRTTCILPPQEPDMTGAGAWRFQSISVQTAATGWGGGAAGAGGAPRCTVPA